MTIVAHELKASHVWPLIVAEIVLIPFGPRAFGRAERYSKRTGKLKRVG